MYIYIYSYLDKYATSKVFSFTRKITFLLYAFYAYQIYVMNMYHFCNRTSIVIRKEQPEPEKSILQSVR